MPLRLIMLLMTLSGMLPLSAQQLPYVSSWGGDADQCRPSSAPSDTMVKRTCAFAGPSSWDSEARCTRRPALVAIERIRDELRLRIDGAEIEDSFVGLSEELDQLRREGRRIELLMGPWLCDAEARLVERRFGASASMRAHIPGRLILIATDCGRRYRVLDRLVEEGELPGILRQHALEGRRRGRAAPVELRIDAGQRERVRRIRELLTSRAVGLPEEALFLRHGPDRPFIVDVERSEDGALRLECGAGAASARRASLAPWS